MLGWTGLYPRLVLLIPHMALLSVLLISHQARFSGDDKEGAGNLLPAQPTEGTVDWYANVQAIQNLMGAV